MDFVASFKYYRAARESYKRAAQEAGSDQSYLTHEYAAIGAGNEVGELLGVVKKDLREQDPDVEGLKYRIADEIGDVLWYLDELASKYGLTLEDAANTNISKLDRRRDVTAKYGHPKE